MRVRYTGPAVTNWYGKDLVTGQEITLPASMAHKVEGHPHFVLLEKGEPANWPEAKEEPEAVRPIAYGVEEPVLPADYPEPIEEDDEEEGDQPAPRRRGRPRKTSE